MMIVSTKRHRPIAPSLLLLALTFFLIAPSEAPKPLVERVILIGIDEVDAATLERFVSSGSMPALAKLVASGTMAPIKSTTPALPPVSWTTVATAMDAKEHGITGFARNGEGEAGDTERKLFDSRDWRAQPIWSLLGRDRTVAVSGWSTTWPARSVKGSLVSDRLLPDRRDAWLPGYRSGADLPRLTYPAALAAELLPLISVDDETLAAEMSEHFLDVEAVAASTPALGDPAYELALAYRRDRGYEQALSFLLADGPADFTAIRMTGLGTALRFFPSTRPTPATGETPDPRGGTVAERYARWLDSRLSKLFAQAGDDCLVILVSDHGFEANRSVDPSKPGSLYAVAEPPGVLVLAGGPVAPGAPVRGARIQDIGTAVLHAFGREVALDMDGTPPGAMLGEKGRASIHYRMSYRGRPKKKAPPPSAPPAPRGADEPSPPSDNATRTTPPDPPRGP